MESVRLPNKLTLGVVENDKQDSAKDLHQINEKKSLFGSSSIGMGNSNSHSTEKEKSLNKLGSTMNVMNDTYQKLEERGEKLNRLADRTEDMVNQASEFARLAKQLNEQQKSRWF